MARRAGIAAAPMAWLLDRAMHLVALAHRWPGVRRVTSPLLYRLHRKLTDLNERRYRARFPSVELVRYRKADLEQFRAAGYQSQGGQDHYVHQAFFNSRQGGVYVDVGANDPVRLSNTFFFDRKLGWRGLAIEPLDKYEDPWRQLRSATLARCVASDAEGFLEFDEVTSGAHTDALSAVQGGSSKHRGLTSTSRRVPARPLVSILLEHGIGRVDLLSIDVEGHELSVLRGMDFGRIAVDVVVIENNVPVLWGSDAIREHMAAHGFEHRARIWQLDDVFVRRGLAP